MSVKLHKFCPWTIFINQKSKSLCLTKRYMSMINLKIITIKTLIWLEDLKYVNNFVLNVNK